MQKLESDWLRSVLVTHEDQCDLLNQQMKHVELVKEQSPTVPFQEPLHHNTGLSLATCLYFPKTYSVQRCLLQREAIRNALVFFGSSNL